MKECDATNATCPRCGSAFLCGIELPTPCHCTEVTLTDAQRAFMAARWQGCLCRDCLLEISRQALPAP